MVVGGIAAELVGALITCAVVAGFPDGGPATIFLPQFLLSLGNGVLLPNAIAGAVSVRPQAAGTAAGMTGFVQMATGAAATQIIGLLVAGATSAMPLGWMMLIEVAAVGVLFWFLTLRRDRRTGP
jgi:DHA1 family bicyclomycin/chloramphenicol resistance-like MFS transporter